YSSFCRGALDELRVWTVARSQAEIQATRNHTLTGAETNLALSFRFDAASGLVVTNLAATGTAYNGSLSNSPVWIAGPPIATAPVAISMRENTISSSSVTLTGSVDTGGATTAFYFQYGTSTNYSGFTATNTLAATNAILSVTDTLSGLSPATLYHARL